MPVGPHLAGQLDGEVHAFTAQPGGIADILEVVLLSDLIHQEATHVHQEHEIAPIALRERTDACRHTRILI